MKDISEDIGSNNYKDSSNLNASNTKPTGKRSKKRKRTESDEFVDAFEKVH
jgi:hypothetical protein